jgi:hypothetical protein
MKKYEQIWKYYISYIPAKSRQPLGRTLSVKFKLVAVNLFGSIW